MRIHTAAAFIGSLVVAAPAFANPALYEVNVDIDNVADPSFTTPLDKEASMQFRRGDEDVSLVVLVTNGSEPDCQTLNLHLIRQIKSESGRSRETRVMMDACGGRPFRFRSGKRDLPSMTVTVKKAGF